MMNGLMWALLCVVSSAVGSICLKQMSLANAKIQVVELILQPLFWCGGFFYFFSFVTYTYAIRVLPLSFIQPIITAGVTLLVSILAITIFGESIKGFHFLGLGLILVGLLMIACT